MPKSNFQSQFSMSKIVKILWFYFHLGISVLESCFICSLVCTQHWPAPDADQLYIDIETPSVYKQLILESEEAGVIGRRKNKVD